MEGVSFNNQRHLARQLYKQVRVVQVLSVVANARARVVDIMVGSELPWWNGCNSHHGQETLW